MTILRWCGRKQAACSGYSDVDELEFEAGELRVGLCFEAIGSVDLRSLAESHLRATGGPVDDAAPAQSAEAQRFAGFFELEADVFFFDDANRRGECEAASDKDGLAISDSEGFAPREPIEEVLCEVAEENFCVALQGWCEHGSCQPG
jgi:hypothetical protein